MKNKSLIVRRLIMSVLVVVVLLVAAVPASAALTLPELGGAATTDAADPNISININGESSDTVNILLLLTILTLIPSILIMMTCFTRIIVVFSMLRNAIGLQQTPPNQVLIGLALFLSLFIMAPVINTINETAYKPFNDGEITSREFLDKAQVPLKEFMLNQTLRDDLDLFVGLSKVEIPEDPMEYPITVVIPSFITSELKRAFTIGFFLYIPFLIIDTVVSSALMSMGMMMLPPITISMPFKLMLFVLVDGWGLLIRALVSTYRL